MKKNSKGWSKLKEEKKKQKQEIGPGTYQGLAKAYEKIMRNSPNFSFCKSITPSVYQVRATKSQAIPGVGAYVEADNAYKKYRLRKGRTPVIFPYKIKRFTESVILKSRETPGPGAYEIIPPLK